MGFIQEWFGFNGWNELSTKGSIFATVAYRVFFVFGLKLLGGDFYVHIHVRFDDIIRLQQLRQRQSVPFFRDLATEVIILKVTARAYCW